MHKILSTPEFDAEMPINDNGASSLIVATRHSDKQMMTLLLNMRASVQSADFKGLTALHHACQEGFSDKVELLLSACSGELIEDLFQMKTKNLEATPFHLAVISGSRSTVARMIRYASLDKYLERTKKGETVFDLASDRFEIRKMLTDAFAYLSSKERR